MEEIKDFVKGGVKGLLALLPAGSVFMSIVQEVQGGILQRRFEDWKDKVDEKLKDLDDKMRPDLANNEMFATVLLLSAQLAIKTNEQKREYLANAVKESIDTNISEDRVIILLNGIEKYTQVHIRLLRFLQNPSEYGSMDDYYMAAATMSIYERYYPEEDQQVMRVAVSDLYKDGMITSDSLNTMQTVRGAFSSQTTDMGNDFIRFFGVERG